MWRTWRLPEGRHYNTPLARSFHPDRNFELYRFERNRYNNTMKWLKRWRKKEDPVCEICFRPLKLTTASLVSGTCNQVDVILRGLPLLSCESMDHPRQFAMADFGVYVIDAVFWKNCVPLGRPGPLAKVKCYECGKNLSKEPTRPSEVAGLLNIGNLPEFGIRIKGPVTTCPRCDTDQLWATREIGRDVSSATVAAFKAAGL